MSNVVLCTGGESRCSWCWRHSITRGLQLIRVECSAEHSPLPPPLPSSLLTLLYALLATWCDPKAEIVPSNVCAEIGLAEGCTNDAFLKKCQDLVVASAKQPQRCTNDYQFLCRVHMVSRARSRTHTHAHTHTRARSPPPLFLQH